MTHKILMFVVVVSVDFTPKKQILPLGVQILHFFSGGLIFFIYFSISFFQVLPCTNKKGPCSNRAKSLLLLIHQVNVYMVVLSDWRRCCLVCPLFIPLRSWQLLPDRLQQIVLFLLPEQFACVSFSYLIHSNLILFHI